MIYCGDGRKHVELEQMFKSGRYVRATCYNIDWGLLLPCESGVIWEQQTEGVCCHHVYLEGILIPLSRPVLIIGHGKDMKLRGGLLGELQNANYSGLPTKKIWRDIKEASAIDFEFIENPVGMPKNQEGFQWILYHGHEEGHGSSFSIEHWKEKPIVLIYPNCD